MNGIPRGAPAPSIANPLRSLGLARILAGLWFISTGARTLRQYHDLVPQAARLFGRDIGATDAPIRSLITLAIAPLLIAIGLVLAWKGARWMRRLTLPPEGPAALEREQVLAALNRRELLAYGGGPTVPYWPLQRWLSGELSDMTWWQRQVMSSGVRVFVRSCVVALVVTALCLAAPHLTSNDLLGPFPAAFVIALPFATAIWAALGLMLIQSTGPRIEPMEFPVVANATHAHQLREREIIETRPELLHPDSAGLGMTLGLAGIAVQCLMLWWWTLSPIGYPLLATSIIRDTGVLAGGVVFFVLGDRMVVEAAGLLLSFRFESIVVLITDSDSGLIARAAAIRTLARGINGIRHIMAATGAPHIRDSAARLIQS